VCRVCRVCLLLCLKRLKLSWDVDECKPLGMGMHSPPRASTRDSGNENTAYYGGYGSSNQVWPCRLNQ